MSFEQVVVQGPFRGIIDNQPRPNKPLNAWDDILNFMVWKGRLRSRPRANASTNPPDGQSLLLILNFDDIQGNTHNLGLTSTTPYYITSGPTYHALTMPGGIPDLRGLTGVSTGLPYGYVISQGRVYFSNGSCEILYTDGEQTLKKANAVGACRFMVALKNHIITAYETEPAPGNTGATIYPFRVRWSASGDGTSWTPGPTSSAGFSDLLEIPNVISGLSTNGRNAFPYYENGVSVMTPTGVGASPFQIDQLSISPKGVGVVLPYTLDTYGYTSAFVSSQDIYTFDGSQFAPIGGEAKKLIFPDLAIASAQQPTGQIMARFGPSLDFLSYWLTAPGANVTWVYSWDDQSWMRFQFSGPLTTLGEWILG